jgi:hypothetical protein
VSTPFTSCLGLCSYVFLLLIWRKEAAGNCSCLNNCNTKLSHVPQPLQLDSRQQQQTSKFLKTVQRFQSDNQPRQVRERLQKGTTCRHTTTKHKILAGDGCQLRLQAVLIFAVLSASFLKVRIVTTVATIATKTS